MSKPVESADCTCRGLYVSVPDQTWGTIGVPCHGPECDLWNHEARLRADLRARLHDSFEAARALLVFPDYEERSRTYLKALAREHIARVEYRRARIAVLGRCAKTEIERHPDRARYDAYRNCVGRASEPIELTEEPT